MKHPAMALVATLLIAIIVVDGDTVDMDGKRNRLLGYDTPETFWAKCRHERQLGHAAAMFLKEMIATMGAGLKPTGRDCGYNRECAFLYIDGVDVPDIMIQQGHARPYNGRGPRGSWCPAAVL